MTAAPAKLPLPKGYFGDVAFTSQEQTKLRTLVKDSVMTALSAEREFINVNNGQVDSKVWKRVSHKQAFQIYRRRNHKVITGSPTVRTPSMLGYGRVDGSLDDILYGWYDKSHEEMQVTMSYVDGSTADCTVLYMLETATPDDPFNYIGVKWVLSKLPIVRARDLCYVDAMGCRRDENGQRYGYVVMHSVDVPNCPPFHRRFAIRAQAFFTFILRERADGSVDAFSHGSFDAAGEMIAKFSIIATSEILSTMFQSVKCGEAKKLTVLAARYDATRRLSQRSVDFDPTTSSSSLGSTVMERCCMCHKKNSFFSSLKNCRICYSPVCASCRTRKRAFTGPKHSIRKVTCCPTCLVAAKQMTVRPAEEEFSILTDQYFLQKSHSKELDSDSSPSGDAQLSVALTDLSIGDLDLESDAEDEVRGVSEEEMEATIEMMLREKQREEAQAALGYSSVSYTAPISASPLYAKQVDVAALERDALFQQMLALQTRSKQVAAITQANEQMMHQITS